MIRRPQRAQDLAEVVAKEGFTVDRGQFTLNQPIKTLGLHKVPVVLHPEVEVEITVNVARSPEEAEKQARGERVGNRDDDDDDDDNEVLDPATLFETAPQPDVP